MTLDDLRRAAELLPAGSSVMLPRDDLLAALGAEAPTPASEPPDEWLTAEKVATMLNMVRDDDTPKVRWVYDHAEQLGVKRLSRRCVRFSSRAVTRYMARRG